MKKNSPPYLFDAIGSTDIIMTNVLPIRPVPADNFWKDQSDFWKKQYLDEKEDKNRLVEQYKDLLKSAENLIQIQNGYIDTLSTPRICEDTERRTG